MKKISADIVVIGSGIAGLYYALKCAEFSNVLILTKGKIGESNTMFAQGGIAAAFGDNDSIESHRQDTLVTGDGLCNEATVNLVVSKAKQCILDLEKERVHFDKIKNGSFDLHKEGGHSHPRVVHTLDATGKEVENSLARSILSNKKITVLEDYFVVDLLITENCCKGALALNKETGEFVGIHSKIVMLATGGAGQVYYLNTNPAIATGDGYAVASRAGAELMNMEFVQFHPTVLYPPTNDTFLITEALRGFGAELKNSRGETFMEKYHPMKSLAPRDIVSRAIFNEMDKSKGNCVYLDLRGFDKNELTKHFPTILATLRDRGIDCTKQVVPVIPAAHYMCGGVAVNLNGETTVENLFACGEVACTGLHGANRLASNSLLEGLVFAEQAAIRTLQKLNTVQLIEESLPYSNHKLSKFVDPELQNDKQFLQKLMWENAGVVRNSERLEECIDTLTEMQSNLNFKLQAEGINITSMELLNMIETSLMITSAALQREESRGCHYREDFPVKSSNISLSFKKAPVLYVN